MIFAIAYWILLLAVSSIAAWWLMYPFLRRGTTAFEGKRQTWTVLLFFLFWPSFAVVFNRILIYYCP